MHLPHLPNKGQLATLASVTVGLRALAKVRASQPSYGRRALLASISSSTSSTPADIGLAPTNPVPKGNIPTGASLFKVSQIAVNGAVFVVLSVVGIVVFCGVAALCVQSPWVKEHIAGDIVAAIGVGIAVITTLKIDNSATEARLKSDITTLKSDLSASISASEGRLTAVLNKNSEDIVILRVKEGVRELMEKREELERANSKRK